MDKRDSSEALPHDRVEALSDLVFGLALSIGAIVLVTQTAPKDSGDVISSLIEFGFSFLVLIRVWTRYTKIMGELPFDTASTRNLNLLLLFLVSIEPYLFYLLYGSLGRHPSILLSADFTTAIYALDLAGLFAVLGFMTYVLAREEKTQHVPELVRNFQFSANTQVVAAALFLISADGFFWRVAPAGIPLRFWIWIFALLIGSVERAYLRRHPVPVKTAPSTAPLPASASPGSVSAEPIQN
ncbi:MAG: TMEM175 family protein [Thermoplasmata archaeon]